MLNESIVPQFLQEVSRKFATGHAREHAYRPAIEQLLESFSDVIAVNDPAHNELGAPDFVLLSQRNNSLIKGYLEAKDVTIDLESQIKTEQLDRYRGYENLIFTNSREFRFYQKGREYDRVTVATIDGNTLSPVAENYSRLQGLLQHFVTKPPERITSGKQLAEQMGAKARIIRDHARGILSAETRTSNDQLDLLHKFMRDQLVADMDATMFADMYAQTLVYGLFVARYNDPDLDTFDRYEARSLIPANNSFLQSFFDHIAGPQFDKRIGYVVDEMCEIFRVSDVRSVVHDFVHEPESAEVGRDPIVHFYEDFLSAYDDKQRKAMGAYYTPTPIVEYIIRRIDGVLKEHFGLPDGIADSSRLPKGVPLWRQGQKVKVNLHRVQLLDIATGTGTFLDQTIRLIHSRFENKLGRWPSYARQNLIPRLFGFELMMAPYTVAHLKLGMTLEEQGVSLDGQRLNIFLTNSLEEGDPAAPDLFSTIGLSAVVTEESRRAAEIKAHYPIMVAMGNPPYSVRSANKNSHIDDLLRPYKEGLNEKKTNLDDDYIKFIRLGESLIERNGSGILAYITNNSYIDGIGHRKMREQLLKTFDHIEIINLNGNSIKRQSEYFGFKDENVFAIRQGVAIIVGVRKPSSGRRRTGTLPEIRYADLRGSRKHKLESLRHDLDWQTIEPIAPSYDFVPRDNSMLQEYEKGVPVDQLFPVSNSGVKTDRDALFVDVDRSNLDDRIHKLLTGNFDGQFRDRYRVWGTSSYDIESKMAGLDHDSDWITRIQYRLMDYRWVYYDPRIISRPASKVSKHLAQHDNYGLIFKRQAKSEREYTNFFITNSLVIDGLFQIDPLGREVTAPLYLIDEDGSRRENINPTRRNDLVGHLPSKPGGLEILDYVYGVFHSPSYRSDYADLLRRNFPRVPVPKDEDEFVYYRAAGTTLRLAHTFGSSDSDGSAVSFNVPGDNFVEREQHKENEVHINEKQWFGNISRDDWSFIIGGYSPLQKFLKDRRGRRMSDDEIAHFCRMAHAIQTTRKTVDDLK